MPLSVDHRKSLSERVLKDPFSPVTIRKRTTLLLASSLSILLVVYNLKVKSTPWLNVEIPTNTPNILHGAIAVALVYAFVDFIWHTWEDLSRWMHADNLLQLHNYFDLILDCRTSLSAIDQKLPDSARADTDVTNYEYFKNTMMASLKLVSKYEDEVKRNKRVHERLEIIQWMRLVVWDIGVPIILGILGLIKIGPAFLPFVGSIFK